MVKNMPAPRYSTVRSDFEYLESIALLDDQVELDAEREALMQNPTKAKAAEMYAAGITLWFYEHGNRYDSDDRVIEIRERYDLYV